MATPTQQTEPTPDAEPRTKFSRAFIIVVILHVIVVASICGVNSYRARNHTQKAPPNEVASERQQAPAPAAKSFEPEATPIKVTATPTPAPAQKEMLLAIKGFPPSWKAGDIIKVTVNEGKKKPTPAPTPQAKTSATKKKVAVVKTANKKATKPAPAVTFELIVKECSETRLLLRDVIENTTGTVLKEYEFRWGQFPQGTWNVEFTPTANSKKAAAVKAAGCWTLDFPVSAEDAASATTISGWQNDKTFNLPWHQLRLELKSAEAPQVTASTKP